MLLTGERVGSGSALGVSASPPHPDRVAGTTPPTSWPTSSAATASCGSNDEVVPYGPDSALYIPAGVWHVVANPGEEPVTMVFAFPGPDYPPTERRAGATPGVLSAGAARRVAIACRLIALEGYVDLTLGHVSAREPGSRTIWIKRKGLALDEVEPQDVIALDLDDPDAL